MNNSFKIYRTTIQDASKNIVCLYWC